MLRTQKNYMDYIKDVFEIYIEDNSAILRAYCYNDNRAVDCINKFINAVKYVGLKFSKCYHANGIGNNNDYTIFIETKDDDGFVIQKNVANFYYCYGIYGGCYVMLKDLSTNEKFVVGKAR